MADDKKKSSLFGKFFGKDRSNTGNAEAEEQASLDKLMVQGDEEPSTQNDYGAEYADWLTDAAAQSSQDPDEDISEALLELFGENTSETTGETSVFEIPGFDELAEMGVEYDQFATEDTAEEEVDATDIGRVESEYADSADSEQETYDEETYYAPVDEAESAELSEYEESDSDDFSEETNEEAEKEEEKQNASSVDEDTATLLAALGYADANTATAKIKTQSQLNVRKRTADLSLAFGYDGKEYTAHSQTAEIKSHYTRDKLNTIIRLGATALVAILLCVYDIFSQKLSGALDPTVYSVVNIMISLQLLLISAAFSAKRLFSGLNSIFKGDLNVYSISAAAVIIAVLYDIVLAIAMPPSFTLCNFPAALCLLLGIVNDYFTLEREICVFDRLSSWQSVATLERIDAAELAAELGEGGIGDADSTVGQAFRMRKGNSIENYFRYINRPHPMSRMLAFFVTPAAALAFVMFFISLAADNTFAQAANALVGVFMFTLPAFMFVSMSFPFYMLITKHLGSDSVVLSESDVGEHRRVDTVVFEESDLFDDNSLAINRISVCDKNQMQDIFDIMCGVSAMYNMIGGRIAGAFRESTAEGDIPNNVTVTEVADGGFTGIADNRQYCVGSDAYLTSKGIAVTRYYDDKYIASNPGGVILHIAVDGIEVFKLYLTYSISPSILSVISELASSKTRIVMRTIDPNVNLDLISRILSSTFDGNLTLVRKPYDEKHAETHIKNEDVVCGGIIVNGETPESLLDTVRSCRFFSAFSKLNFVAGIVVFVISALLAITLGIIGAMVDLPSIYICISQMISLLPSIVFANIYLKK